MQFFVLEQKPVGTNARTDAIPEERSTVGEAPRCPTCGGFIGMLKWLPPYCIEVDTWGRRYGDFAFNGNCEWFVVSDRFREILLKNGLKGLSGFDSVVIAKITHHNKELLGDPPQYFKVDVVRSRAVIDQIASGFEWSEGAMICPECLIPTEGLLKRWKGIIIRPESWQGEDIFIARGCNDIIVTSYFKDLCEGNELENAVFTPADTYGRDWYPWER